MLRSFQLGLHPLLYQTAGIVMYHIRFDLATAFLFFHSRGISAMLRSFQLGLHPLLYQQPES
ncbi:hypothetical protein [Paenibacillus sp.]|uniref:hypothetical protein n=1 Tax=Paenibacillus sp. TaxID=58172 RepID=UPI003561DF65